MALIPPVGTAGIFTLQAPFAVKLITGAPYTCMAVRRLADVIHEGIEPYERYYEPFGLTREIYTAALAEDVCIVSLRSSGGQWLEVPSTYILSYPDQGGVPYTSLVLAVNIGPIPNHLNLAAIKQRLIDDVRDYIGIDSSVMTVAVSETKLIAQSISIGIEAARVAQINTSTTDRAKLIAAQAVSTAALAKIAELEAYIKTNLPP